MVFYSFKVIRDVIKVHMEELSNHWQEQERAEDGAEKYAIVFTDAAFAYLIFCLCWTQCRALAV